MTLDKPIFLSFPVTVTERSQAIMPDPYDNEYPVDKYIHMKLR